MSRKRKFETDAERSERLRKAARELHAQESQALDAMVRKSIKLHGA